MLRELEAHTTLREILMTLYCGMKVFHYICKN
jgi:hypothetical protein